MFKKIVILLTILGLAFGLLLLTTGESHFEVQSHARLPVAQGTLWQRLMEVERWPSWWPGMEEVRLSGDFKTGNRFSLRLKGMPARDEVLITRVSPPREFAWEGPGVLGSRTGTRLSLEQDGAGCRLTVVTFVHGPQAFLARMTGEAAFKEYQLALLARLERSLASKPPATGEKD